MLNNNQKPQKINQNLPSDGSPLSKAHIRPFGDSRIEFVSGASLIRSTKGREMPAVGGGRRGGIKGFSVQSRRRLLELIASVRRDADLPCFVTLTYPGEFPTVERAKRDLKVFSQRLERKFAKLGAIWKLEPQERGAPHYHMLVWGVPEVDLLRWVVRNWYQIAGNGDHRHLLFHMGVLKDSKPCVSKVRSWRGVWAYASKYIGKTFTVAQWGDKWTGRFWGVIGRENIPFGELQQVDLSYYAVVQVMRFQRRFMKKKINRDLNSLKTFCDADQWINNLVRRSANGIPPEDSAPRSGARAVSVPICPD